MEYLFDLFLNWQSSDELYDFFEWSTDDDIEVIKIIPIIKVEKEEYIKALHQKVKFKKDLLEKVFQKTQIQNNVNISVVKYAFILTEGNDAFAVECDDYGFVFRRSSIQLDCVEEVISKNVSLSKEIIVKVEEVQKKKWLSNSRKEREKIALLGVHLDRMYLSSNKEKLRYLYNDVFGCHIKADFEMYQELKTELDKKWNNNHQKIYELVQIMSTN